MKDIISLLNHISEKNKRRLLIAFSLILISALTEMLSLASTVPLLNTIVNSNSYKLNIFYKFLFEFFNLNNNEISIIIFLCLIASFMAISSSLIRAITLKYSTKLSTYLTNDLSSKAFINILNRPYEWHINENSGDIIAKMNYFSKLINGIFMPFILLTNSIVSLITLTIILFTVTPLGTITLILSILFLYLITLFITSKRLRKLSNIQKKYNLLFVRSIQESLGSIKAIILQDNRNFYHKNFSKSDLKLRSVTSELLFMNGSPRIIIEGLGLSFILIITSLFTISLGMNVALPKISIIALTFLKMLPSAQSAYNAYAQYKGNKFIVDTVLEFLEFHQIDLPKFNEKNINFKFDRDIQLKNLSFLYENRTQIFKDLNLTIKKGDKLGIIGETGSGKSTLIDLILALLKPKKGKLLIDDLDVWSSFTNLNNYRSLIYNVPQEIYLSDSTILENIAYGIPKEKIDEKLIKNVIKISQSEKFIEKLPDGIYTNVGERGISLSGGQKQRIGIARSLYFKPKILILDEATSALDEKTERELFTDLMINQQEITIIMITHRIYSLKYCNRVIKVENGKLKDLRES